MTTRQSIQKAIRDAETEFGKMPGSVSLLAVSKTQSIEKIKAVYDQGQKCFGENYLQEALVKIEALKNVDIEWHFIGGIQSNKTKLIAEHFDWVQSVASLKVAERLNAQRPQSSPPLNVCIQVNISQEPNKDGATPGELLPLAEAISRLKNLKLRGIMVIPKAETDFNAQVAAFEKAHDLYNHLIQKGFPCDTLSMGMSGDFKAAIKAGSTMVRIGSAIFGLRV